MSHKKVKKILTVDREEDTSLLVLECECAADGAWYVPTGNDYGKIAWQDDAAGLLQAQRASQNKMLCSSGCLCDCHGDGQQFRIARYVRVEVL